jgi:beta-lactamase regulating signal transducer with metallopeptidase domain
MILYADGHPVGKRYSVGFIGSIVFHVLLVAAVLFQAGQTRTADPFDGRGITGRNTGRHSSALLRAGQFGGEPTGAMGAMRQPVEEQAWPVKQAERLGLRLAIGRVIDHLWQSTLFAIAVGLLTLAFRRNRARVRYALWFAASVKFLVPFSVMVWFGSVIASSVVAIFAASDPVGAAGSLGASASSGTATDASWVWALFQEIAKQPLIAGFGQSLAATGTVLWPSAFTISEVTGAWLSLALLGIWTGGFFAIVASRVRLSQKLWDVALTSRRVELIDVKVPKRLQVGLADGLLEPGVIGWLRPVLLLPADIERHLARPEIEAIVAHELCHVRRYDNMTAAIHMVAEAIFWFHPLVWWLGARLIDERERACDEHVLRSVGAPGPYAQGILNVCKRYVESPLASVSGVGSANVRQRIDAILANRIGEATSPWKKMMLSALILFVVIVPLAAGALQPAPARGASAPGGRSGASPLEEGPRHGWQRAEPLPRATTLRTATSVTVSAATEYALVIGRANGLGPELRPVSASARARGAAGATGARPRDAIVRPGEISAEAISLPRFAALLGSVLDREVEDRTGLAGDFTIRLTWIADGRDFSLFAAVERQLGLRLVPLDAANGGPPLVSR